MSSWRPSPRRPGLIDATPWPGVEVKVKDKDWVDCVPGTPWYEPLKDVSVGELTKPVRLGGVVYLELPIDLLDFIIKEQRITKVVIAIPSAPGKMIRQLSNVIRGAGIETKTVPGIYNLLGNQSWKPDLRDISIEDRSRRTPHHSAARRGCRRTAPCACAWR